MNKRKVGAAYEKRAGAFLEEQGLRILCYNFRNRSGEIDIVARDGETTVFVEVKYRRDEEKGAPEAADLPGGGLLPDDPPYGGFFGGAVRCGGGLRRSDQVVSECL